MKDAARQSFYEETLVPLADFMASGFNKHLLEDGTELSYRFDFSNVAELQADITEISNRATLLFEKGLATRDEARAMVDLPPVGGDEGGFKAPAPSPMAAPVAQDEPDDEADEGKTTHGKAELPAAGGGFPDDVKMELALRQEYARMYTKATKQLQDTGSIDVASLGENFGADIEASLKGISQENAMKTLYQLRKEAGLSVGGEDMLTAFDVVNPHLERRVKEQVVKLSDSTMQTLGRELNDVQTSIREVLIKEGIRGPNTLKAMQEGVRHVFDGMEKWKARQIAITESSRAVNDANIIAASESNVSVGLVPVVSPDACELCQVYNEDGTPTGEPLYPYTSTQDAVAQIGEYENRTLPPYHPLLLK